MVLCNLWYSNRLTKFVSWTTTLQQGGMDVLLTWFQTALSQQSTYTNGGRLFAAMNLQLKPGTQNSISATSKGPSEME